MTSDYFTVAGSNPLNDLSQAAVMEKINVSEFKKIDSYVIWNVSNFLTRGTLVNTQGLVTKETCNTHDKLP